MGANLLDEIASVVVFSRINYAPLTEPKPNDHCYADEWNSSWMEDDNRYRARLKEAANDRAKR